ncbi:helix-turn-helix domain-containing protein [uncultured Corynebacterium sp.]|uniref:helix-turn-helix domain-containing protein n=1 Tax=uncultured Corynebacterium sp. TaxID=159447 RepID=UPI00338E8B98
MRKSACLCEPRNAGPASRARTTSPAPTRSASASGRCAKGLSIRAIANETGYSVGTVHRYVKEAQDA